MNGWVLGISLAIGAGLIALFQRGKQELREDEENRVETPERPLPPEREDE